MSAAEQHAHPTVRESAQLMGDLGLSLVPIGVGQKYPPIQAWQDKATSSAGTHDEWWGNGTGWGIGWKMGLQDNGSWLFALDVDGDVGEAQMRALWAEWDIKGALVATVQAVTGGGGKHFIFSLPSPAEWIVTRSKLADGIDIRAEGGQIVVAPTLHPDTRKAYRWSAGCAPWERPILEAPEPLLAMMRSLLVPPPVTIVNYPLPPRTVGRLSDVGPSPADWVREHLDWQTYMPKHGWQMVRSLAGQTWWKRPGKTDKGHSAVLHDNGVLVVFSLEIPPQLAGLGHRTRGDEGLSFSLFDFIAAYEHGGDRRALARHIGETYLRRDNAPQLVLPGGVAEVGTSDTRQAGPSAEYLTDGFWDSLPVLAQIRQAARATRVGPDAVLANVLALWATIIPPSYMLPDVVGDKASLNYLACMVSKSGVGKTAAYRVARRLVTTRDEEVRFGAVAGSGQGVVKAYLDDVKVEDPETGKPITVQKQVWRGIHWNVDEGVALAAGALNSESVIMPTLTSAWSGEALGQENAKRENFRRLEAQAYRLTATISVQEENAHQFHTPYMQRLGVTGRLQFAFVHDLTAPIVRPDWPGEIILPSVPDILTGVTLTYPQYVWDSIDAAQYGILNGTQLTTLRESQYTLLRCKIAGLLALLTGSRAVTDLAWQLSGEVINCSRAIISKLESDHLTRNQAALRDKGHNQATVELAIEDRKDLVAIDKLSNRIVEAVLGQPGHRWSRGKLARALTNSTSRHRFEPALNRAVSGGRVALDGEFIVVP